MSAPGPGDLEATLVVILQAADPMEHADEALQAFGRAVADGAEQGAGGAGDGPLAGVLAALGSEGRARAEERGDECGELAEAMRESVANYRHFDGLVGQQFMTVHFGGV